LEILPIPTHVVSGARVSVVNVYTSVCVCGKCVYTRHKPHLRLP